MALCCTTASGVLRVSADALTEYTLTAEQTLALYGSTLDLEIYANNSTYHKEATFVGTTDALTDLNGYPTNGPSMFYVFGTFYDNVNDWMNLARMQSTNYLIYRILVSPWSQPGGVPFSINLTNSVDITAQGFGTSILWSVYPDPGYAPNNDASNPYYECSYTLYGQSLQDVQGTGGILAAGDIASQNYMYYASLATQPYGIEVIDQQGLYIFNYPTITGLGSYYGATAFAGSRVSGSQPVTIGSQAVYIKNESNIYPKTGYSGGHYFNKLQERGDTSDFCTYLFVQCPTLYGEYTLPGGDTPGGVDLSQIEEYLDDLTGEAAIQTAQLADILRKLNDIYSAIQSSGFNPTLNPTAAQTLPRLNWSSQESAIATGTLSAQDVEDMTPAADMLTGALGDIADASGLTLFAFGLVSLCAAGWFLTRGRG